MSRRPARLGLLGAGFVSDFYLRALAHVRDHEVVGVWARREEAAREFADRWEIPFSTGSRDELLAREDVDIVVIGLPHHLHVDAVTAAAQAGKAVICTKPLGRNGEEARACLEAVEQAGVWHAYAETELFVPTIVRAKQLVDSGAVGRPYWIRAREAHGHPHPHARDRELMGGGPLRGIGIHGVAIGRWFLGGRVPTEVFAWGDRLVRDDVQAEDSAVAMLKFDDGAMTQVEVGWGHKAGLDVRTEIHCSDGYISTDHTGNTGIRAFATESAGYVLEKAEADTGWISPVPQEPWAFGYHAEFDHFIHCWLDGREPIQTLRDGVIDNAIVDAAYRSMESGTWQAVETGLALAATP